MNTVSVILLTLILVAFLVALALLRAMILAVEDNVEDVHQMLIKTVEAQVDDLKAQQKLNRDITKEIEALKHEHN